MEKREFERYYGDKVDNARWEEVENAWYNSPIQDKQEFANWVRDKEEQIETTASYEKTDVSESLFKAMVKRRFKDTPFAPELEYFDKTCGKGNVDFVTKRYSSGFYEEMKDCGGEMITHLTGPDGRVWRVFYQFTPTGNGKGDGRVFFRNDYLRELCPLA